MKEEMTLNLRVGEKGGTQEDPKALAWAGWRGGGPGAMFSLTSF